MDPSTASEPVLRTFLIADVRGYSTFTRERGDAAAALLSTKFADLARDAVEARSGRVVEIRGDEAFAVFGSAAQAVRAAVELQATFAEESLSDPAFQLPVGIGIDTGEAVPVEEGYRGAAVNMAARLCSSAAAGQVLVTGAVAELVGTAELVFADRGRSTFKGFEEPVEVIEALAPARPHPEARAPDAGPGPEPAVILPPELDPSTELVDREHELRWLRGTWRAVCRGHGRLLLVSGPAQIGKTRLAGELAAYVHARGADVRYAGPGGAGTAVALAAVRGATHVRSETLIVLDDLDVAGPEVSAALIASYDAIDGCPVLVLGLMRDRAASAQLASLITTADGGGDGHRELGPLGLEGVREIVRQYVGDAEAEAPVESFARASQGVPGLVHEVVSDWTRDEASRRLSAAAEFLAAGRRRHASDLEFANNAIALKLGRLYAVGGRDVPTVEVCPYQGLTPFGSEDSGFFFGRERLVGELAARSVDVGLLGVVGASGSGKSSAIAAGLIPSLDAGLLPGSERWRHVSIRPGAHPMAELHKALPTDIEGSVEHLWDGRLVLVVDQLEELFTTCTDTAEREAFVDALIEPALENPDRVVVVAVLRADFYGQLAAHPALARAVGENHVLVGPMSKDELRRAIELPARRAGLRVESSLAERLVADVADETGGLPLLSTALVELWQGRDDRWLRLATYERTGGVRGAVARLAEATYAQLSSSEQEATPGVFLRLVGPGEGAAVTRRRVPIAEFDLERSLPAAAVIRRFTQDRLLTVDDGTAEVAHEALLRAWPRLSRWLDEDTQGRALRQHLAETARSWDLDGREPAELYRGPRLSAALDWAPHHDRQLNELERSFLVASRQASEREADRQRRANRRLRGLLVGVAMFLAVALVAGSIALVQRSRARSAFRAATAQRLGAQALQQDDLDLSLLLARQGVALDDSPVTDRNAALVGSPAAIRVVHPLPGLLTSAVISPDGSLVAVGNFRVQGTVLDTASYRPVATLPGQPWAISPDGRMLVNTPGLGTLAIVDPDTGAQQALDQAAAGSSALWISTDFRELATVEASVITFWDTSTVTESGHLRAAPGRAFLDVYYSPEGRHLVTIESTGDGSPELRWVLRDVVTRRPERTITTTDSYPNTYTMTRDGRWIAFGWRDGTITAVNVTSGDEIVMDGRHAGGVDAISMSRDDTTLASGGEDDAIKVWDLPSGELRETLTGHTHWVSDVAISPDGRNLYSVSLDGSLIVWDLEGSRRLGRPFVASSGSFGVTGDYPPVPHLLSVSPDGGLIASPGCGGRVVVRAIDTLQEVSTISAVRSATPCGVGAAEDRWRAVYDTAFTPDGEDLVVGGPRGQVTMFDARSGAPTGPPFAGAPETFVDPLRGRIPDTVEAIAVSPDGTIVAAGTPEGRVYLWDRVTGDPIRPPLKVPDGEIGSTPSARDWVFDLGFSPDGGQLVAAHGSVASVWSTDGWVRRYTVNVDDGAGAAYSASFSPDGRMLATAGGITDLRLWNAVSGAALGSIPVDTTYTVSLGWSPDSSTVVTGGWDGSIKLVDVASRSIVGALPGPTHRFNAVAFTPDGSEVLVVYRDGRALEWDLDPAAWAQRACDVAGRTLTRSEWDRFLPELPYDPACSSPERA
jgi:WD40 repeat protein/class 3 adenylate cyclase